LKNPASRIPHPTSHNKEIAINRQQGSTLLVSLILLLMLSLLAATVARTSALQQRMSGNQQQQNLVFQAAENGIKAAIIRLADSAQRPTDTPKKLCATSYDGTLPVWGSGCPSSGEYVYEAVVSRISCAGDGDYADDYSTGVGKRKFENKKCYQIKSTAKKDGIRLVHYQGVRI